MSTTDGTVTDESESEVFFDAEEKAPISESSLRAQGSIDSSSPATSSSSICDTRHLTTVPRLVTPLDDIPRDAEEPKATSAGDHSQPQVSEASAVDRRRKLLELRRKLCDEDDDLATATEGTVTEGGDYSPDQPSSVDGIFAAMHQPRNTLQATPFKVVEPDAVSLASAISLGNAGGRIRKPFLAHSQDTSSVSSLPATISGKPSAKEGDRKSSSLTKKQEETRLVQDSLKIVSSDGGSTDPPCQMDRPSTLLSQGPALMEPDLVTSSKKQPMNPPPPVAPPRRRRGDRKDSSTSGQTTPMRNKESPFFSTPIPPHGSDSSGHSMVPAPSVSSSMISSDASPLGSTGPSPFSPETRSANDSQPEFCMDLSSATQGLFLVRPAEENSTRGRSKGGTMGSHTGSSLDQDVSAEDFFSEAESSKYFSASSKHSSLDSTHRSHSESLKKGGSGDRDCLHVIPDLGSNENILRLRTSSGRNLTDQEILDQVLVTNLDTGEKIPLSQAEDKMPKGVNPLSLHIMRMTSEYPAGGEREDDGSSVTGDACSSGVRTARSSIHREMDSDDESIATRKSASDSSDQGGVRRKTEKIRRFFGRTVGKTKNLAKNLAHEVGSTLKTGSKEGDASDLPEDTAQGDTGQIVKMKASHSHKGPYDFDHLIYAQNLSNEQTGPIWCCKFSCCGRLLATAGQDNKIRIWCLKHSLAFFTDMRTRYNADIKTSPTPSQESLQSQHSSDDNLLPPLTAEEEAAKSDYRAPFGPRPFCIYTGHTAHVLDLSWSKNYFLLSSSMDKTVRLWHISRKECLCCFNHIDFVTAICFHPRDDRYFLSGSLDGKLRLWNIPDKKVTRWNEVEGIITAASFCQNGKIAAVGTYDGRLIFYTTDKLSYHTVIFVRSSRGKNKKGRKISGIEPAPGENNSKILVTSNDSRLRMYDLSDLSLSCKYKGLVNTSHQIKASFSPDGLYIISGSENFCFYLWKTNHDYAKFSSARRDRNDYWEGIKAHNSVVTAAVFAPNPHIIFHQVLSDERTAKGIATPTPPHAQDTPQGHVIVTADYQGCIKVFMNRAKPKHSSLPAAAMANRKGSDR